MRVVMEQRSGHLPRRTDEGGAVDAGVAGAVGVSDAELVERARLGDRAAWAALYRRFAPVVHGVLLCRVNRADADDLTQDVFVQAMRRLGDVREGASVGGWLVAMARNAAATLGRRPRASRLGDVAVVEVGMQSGVEVVEEAERVLGVIRSLPEAYRETLVLRLVEGLTGPELAERMGMTHGSVRVNLFRGMAMLKEKLAGGAGRAGDASGVKGGGE